MDQREYTNTSSHLKTKNMKTSTNKDNDCEGLMFVSVLFGT